MTDLNEKCQKRLDDLERFLAESKKTFIGYPCVANFDYSELYRFLKYPLNNVGDPFSDGQYHIHTRDFEVEVLEWFAKLNNAPMNNYWGYVTNGGSEGNLYGLYLARELYPKGVVYYSQDTHYSVSKNIRLLGMEHVMIKSRRNGEMDYDDFHSMLSTWRSQPPIIFANIGTTMKEATDDLEQIKKVLKDLAIPEYYIHVDAALCGMIRPFLDGSKAYDFAAGAQSIAISGHKFIGSPVPCGVVLALKSNVGRITRAVEYIKSLDTTVTGSRNGFTPLVLWYAIKKLGYNGFRQRANGCVDLAARAVKIFNDEGIKAWRNPGTVTIVIPRPSEKVCYKWQLAVQDDIAHVMTMPHVTEDDVHEIIKDIKTA